MAMWRYVNRISTDVPEEWDVLETTELRGPDGVRMRITTQPAVDELTSGSLAERHQALLASQLEGYHRGPLVTRSGFGGRETLRQMVEWREGDEVGRSVTDYLVADGVVYLATATGSKEALERHAGTIDAVLDSVVALGGPLSGMDAGVGEGEPSTSVSEPDQGSTPRRPPVDEVVWRALAETWATADPAPDGRSDTDADAPISLSLEELLVVAATVGVGVFPTIDPAPFAALTLAERSAIGRAVARGLRLRRFLDGEGDTAQPSARLASLIEVALFPDLLTELHVIELSKGEAVDMVAYSVRPDAMVVTRTAGPYGRALTTRPAGQLLATLMSDIGDALEKGEVSVRIRSTWRDTIGLLTSDLNWQPGDPADAIKTGLLANLPGALEPAPAH